MIGESYGWRGTRNEGDKKEKRKGRKEEWKGERERERERERETEIQSTYISHHKFSP